MFPSLNTKCDDLSTLQNNFFTLFSFFHFLGSVPSLCSGRQTRTRVDSCVVPSQLVRGSWCLGRAQGSSNSTMCLQARRKPATAVTVQPSLTWSPQGLVEEATCTSVVEAKIASSNWFFSETKKSKTQSPLIHYHKWQTNAANPYIYEAGTSKWYFCWKMTGTINYLRKWKLFFHF